MGEFGLENIMTDEQVNDLFIDDDIEENVQVEKPEEKQEQESVATEVDTEDLFLEKPESVGSEEIESHEEGKSTSEKSEGSSPKNFYSSIAKALKEDGALPDLSDDFVGKITDAESFAEAIEQQIKSGLNERQRRIDDALNYGMEASEIKQFENTISFLDSISTEKLNADDDAGVNLRKQLIYQDLINKGYSKDEALEEIQDIFESNTDIKKAARALTGNKEFFKRSYQNALNEAKEKADAEKLKTKQQAEELRKSILDSDTILGQKLDRATRQNIYNSISVPAYKDEDGTLLTALQKYQKENKNEFMKIVGYFFERTDHFKNLEKIIKPEVNKSVRKNIKELERTLNNTSRASDGSLRFTSGVSDDPESSIGSGWNLDI